MDVFERHQQTPRPPAPSVLTIGSFDGLHCGHQALLQRVVEQARAGKLRAGVMTFRPHPARLLAPRYSPPLLMSPARKVRALASLGLDFALVQRFDHAFASLSTEDFAGQVLVEALGVRRVVVGDDFTFGRERRGQAEDLVELGQAYGFEVDVIRRLAVEGMAVSSTRIRSFLLQGNVKGAGLLLGRPFAIDGEVVTGEGRGRKLGFPTANIRTTSEILPARGVYACAVWLEGDPQAHLGATNVGMAPTFGGGVVGIEVHILDYEGELVGRRMAVGFIERLREERAFQGADQLVDQVTRDIREARKIGRASGGPPGLHPLNGIQLDRGAG